MGVIRKNGAIGKKGVIRKKGAIGKKEVIGKKAAKDKIICSKTVLLVSLVITTTFFLLSYLLQIASLSIDSSSGRKGLTRKVEAKHPQAKIRWL